MLGFRALSAVLLIAHVLSGCTVRSTRRVEPEAVPAGEAATIIGARMTSGQGVRFDRPRPERMEGGVVLPAIAPATFRSDSLLGSVGSRWYSVPIDRVLDVEIEESRTSAVRTGLLIGGIGLAVFTLVGAVAFEELW
jgi:hypothetical protein